MKVRELIEILKTLNPELEVMYSSYNAEYHLWNYHFVDAAYATSSPHVDCVPVVLIE